MILATLVVRSQLLLGALKLLSQTPEYHHPSLSVHAEDANSSLCESYDRLHMLPTTTLDSISRIP